VAIAIYTFVALKNADEINFKKEYETKIFNEYNNPTSNSTKEFVDLIQKEVRLPFEIILFYTCKTIYHVTLFEFLALSACSLVKYY